MQFEFRPQHCSPNFPSVVKKIYCFVVDVLTLFSIQMHMERRSNAWNKATQLSADFQMATVINFEILKGITACTLAVL